MARMKICLATILANQYSGWSMVESPSEKKNKKSLK
jgi:hypothetical protein